MARLSLRPPEPSARQWWTLRIASMPGWPVGLRRRLYARAGVAIDPSTFMLSGLVFTAGRTTVGGGGYLGWGCHFDDYGTVTIGDGVWIAARCHLVTNTHEFGPPERRAGTPMVGSIEIEDGCWLGAGVTVLPGVSIGAGCIVAAGAVVAADCAAHGLYAGVPARRIRDLDLDSGALPADRALAASAEPAI